MKVAFTALTSLLGKLRTLSWRVTGLLFFLVPLSAPAATITVTSVSDSGAGSLRQAILVASPGDTINFAAGIATIDLLSGELLIDKDLAIIGPGPNLLTVRRSAAAAFRIFHIASTTVTATISGLKIADGRTVGSLAEHGGGISNAGTLTVSNAVFTGNKAANSSGGGIYNSGLLTVTDSTFSANSTDWYGGGLSNASRLTIVNSTISANSADGRGGGGGLSNSFTMTISNCFISGNLVASNLGGARGGGIYNNNDATMTIANSTVAGNSAVSGGGIYTNVNGSLTITDSTLSGNLAGSAIGQGGGIYNRYGAPTIIASTLTGNSAAAFGGGIYNESGPVTARNSIIALNASPSGPDAYGTLTSQNFNLIGNSADATITPVQASDQIGTAGSPIDPLLGPLQDNGGPMLTHALLFGSSAIDGGDDLVLGSPLSLATDQRGAGFPRKIGAHVDIGAFEFNSVLGAGSPVVTMQPTSVTVNVTANASFTVAATGTPAPTYQWQVSTNNGANWSYLVNSGTYSGVSLATLVVTTASGMSGTQYRCVAANSAGAVASNAAIITVNQAPGAPVIGTPIDGNFQTSIFFTAPASNGGLPITSYTATCTSGGSFTASRATSPITITGLANGTTYSCSVTATNAVGISVPSATASATPSAVAPLTLVNVVSRKTHDGVGAFDIDIAQGLAINGPVSVEPRMIGAGHTLVFQFNGAVGAVGPASVIPVGAATATFLGNEALVTLTGVPDNQRVTVTLTNVNGSVNPPPVSMGFLVGDLNSSRSVNSTDISGVKARSGQTTNGANFRADVNTSGAINSTDLSAVKARSGLTLP